MQKRSRVLNIYLNSIEVGTLTLLSDDRTLFTFSESYIQNSNRPILSQWFQTSLGELRIEEKIRGAATLPPFFSNLLPEGHLRQYLAKSMAINPEREFFLISALGTDLPGAVIATADDATSEDGSIAIAASKQATSSVMRFSLAGVQFKFSAVVEPKGGLTIRTDGSGGSWIVKLPSTSFPNVPEVEFSMLTLAKRIGISVPEFKLIDTSDIKGLPPEIKHLKDVSLAIKRFDRSGDGNRIHMEDFAQIFGLYPNEKYQNASFSRIANVILNECGETDFVEYVRRLVFIVASGNGDMHAKNWSLLYSDPRSPRLSPAYDLVPTLLYLPNDDLGIRLGNTKAFHDVTHEQFRRLAKKVNASEKIVLNTVKETVQIISEEWKNARSDFPMSKEMNTSLDQHIQKVLTQLQ